jgi:hypothetical protein
MVQEVFNEHKLPVEFASKVIENVPSLGWGRGKDCTFAGALEAALAATAHPCKYTDIMGFTALAFRTRWYKGGKGWCNSAAVGEMGEEISAASRATGWPLKVELHFDEKDRPQATANIVESINAGKPVPAYTAYDPSLDMAVVYGYGEGGTKLLLRDYHKGDQPLELPAGKIGWMWFLLGEHKEVISTTQAVIEGLKMAVHNWRRKVGKEGPGEYWYGPAAYEAWIGLLQRADGLGPEDRPGVLGCSRFCHAALLDARRSAVAFLREHAPRWQGPPREALKTAADSYEGILETANSPKFKNRDCFLGHEGGMGIDRWTPEVRRREITFLRKAMERDEAAIAGIEKALGELTT